MATLAFDPGGALIELLAANAGAARTSSLVAALEGRN
jgi:hypothetical protein